MKASGFARDVGLSPSMVGCFMKLDGRYSGTGNATYAAATVHFQKLEQGRVSKKCVDLSEVSDIQLQGEVDNSVPIYEPCDDIRERITAIYWIPTSQRRLNFVIKLL